MDSGSVAVFLLFTIFMVAAIFALVYFANSSSSGSGRHHGGGGRWFPPYYPPQPSPSGGLIGGCAGTRYGCCSNGVTAKINTWGSNCPVY